ncbi:MAG TPA: alcohol dehydrogenase catalytic domain-containing protein [Armatimonadota bacterium]|jgi:threonine dehydrogenase-like Zn-dependent dehydrogenase
MGSINVPESAVTPRFVGGGRIEYAEAKVPRPGPGQLLLRVRANALCGSERGQFYGGSQVTPGHEAAGEVVAAGTGTSTAPGTLGVVYLMDYCGECRSCRAGATNQCFAKRADMGFSHDGGYGPYELVNENCFFAIDSDMDPAEATLLLDILGTGGHALNRAGLVHSDVRSLFVAGAGPIGLAVLASARIRYGAELPVWVSDTIPYRLALVERLGGTPIDLKEGAPEAAIRSKMVQGVDVAVDTSGKGAARQSCLEALAQRGVLVCVGHGEAVNVDVSRQLIGPERAILGSEYFPYSDLAANLPLLRRHRDLLSRILTHRVPIARLQEAFETFFAGNTGKVVAEQ